ncbi:hypothetical protein [Candidatus Binatus sp.]|jgi:hypothetical protein|uniref:hypothetical protein n=1 Tax=Candidatus Binatus sp. TaxID=2811406 RepID=UPI002FDB48CC
MADSTGIGKVLRDITQAYVDGLSTIGGAIADLAKRRIPDGERQMEHWIGVARAAKDGYVAAIDQGFAIWERRIRQTVAPAQSSSSANESKSGQKAPASQIEAWLEEWRNANEFLMQSIRESGLGEEALKQTRELRKTFEDGLKNLQKLWQPSSKSSRK